MFLVLASAPNVVRLTVLSEAGDFVESREFPLDELAAEVAALEPQRPRWVWDDTSRWYPTLLEAGVRIERCVDLRLSHAILRGSGFSAGSALASRPSDAWDRVTPVPFAPRPAPEGALFELADLVEPGEKVAPTATAETEPLIEFLAQREAVASCVEPGRIGLLLAAESAGALIAAELTFAGMPWRSDVHERLLVELLGDRPSGEERPERLELLLAEMRRLLDVDDLNPDSPSELLKGLARGGVLANSTRSWELKRIDHPVIAPLLEYKKLSRLLSANGWNWLETWVRDGRFRPDYVPGGAATGRWATSGGGALQLPRQIRRAAVADAGWKLVVADAAQLEPRILAALSADRGMIEAGTAGDLYAGIVSSGAVDTREHAKVALLGAMYGATTGESGRLMPRLARAYPKAIAMVEQAARAGERGEVVSTRLGRGSPLPGEAWRELQAEALGEGATDARRSRARGSARSWGRFTRNFIVQGTAAEWALCWMAEVRRRLWALTPGGLTAGPHLVFFLHDEVVVHCPAELAEDVAEEVRSAAREAGRLLFGALPIQFPVTVAIVDDYGAAK